MRNMHLLKIIPKSAVDHNDDDDELECSTETPSNPHQLPSLRRRQQQIDMEITITHKKMLTIVSNEFLMNVFELLESVNSDFLTLTKLSSSLKKREI